MTGHRRPQAPDNQAAAELAMAATAKKCWACGCLVNSLDEIEREVSVTDGGEALRETLSLARSRLSTIEYDCLGCPTCYPANAIHFLHLEHGPCDTDIPKERAGWPPLPGNYKVLRADAPVAVCTLTDEKLAADILSHRTPEVSIVGILFTENLGIERLIKNVITNPHIRRIILCGRDSQQAIGHLPGQSLMALVKNGVDERGRIIGSRGKRPNLTNISREAVEHFRRSVQVVDLVGETSTKRILAVAGENIPEIPPDAGEFPVYPLLQPVKGYVPERMTSDPSGYFVIYPERSRRKLVLEHYTNGGVLDAIVEGSNEAELYTPAIDQGLVSRLDHAAYLGKELARAMRSLQDDADFVQDSAPEESDDGCNASSCGCH